MDDDERVSTPPPSEEAIPILRVTDATASAEWYEGLGFQVTNVHRFHSRSPAFVTVTRGDVTLFLSEHTGDAPPGGLVYVRLRAVDELAAGLGATVHDNAWGRDFEVVDPDGNRLRIGTPSWW